VIYEVTQVTTVNYAAVVPFAQHMLRMTPLDRPGQAVLEMSMKIDPEPTQRLELRDFFGNSATQIEIATAHNRLVVKSWARVRVDPVTPPLADLSPAWEEVRDEAMASNGLDAESPVHFIFPSRVVQPYPPARDYAAQSFPPGRSILAGAMDLTRRIHKDFTFAPGSTDVRTDPSEAFEQGGGVCQDFAHIMITGMRDLGLPAAYVSGCLRTYPPPGQPRLAGADATHAWVSVWCGDAGWYGLDPTNAIAAGEDHIVLAVGRDYEDVAPVTGIIVSAGDQMIHAAVDVLPMEVRPVVVEKRSTGRPGR
jgi:transglutaminase-like putative cysteine protease